MFTRLVEEYQVNVPARDVRAYDALIAHRILRFEDAKACFDDFDGFVADEVERCWKKQLRQFGSLEHRELREWKGEYLPNVDFWNHFWSTPVIVRLTEPKMVRLYLDSQFAVSRRFELDLEIRPREYVLDLLRAYERAYAFVHHQVWKRLYGGNESD
jgi:hypothetical protein